MSDPYLTQISFKIDNSMPKDMKMLLLYLFTDYYITYYPNKEPDFETVIKPLYEKYPAINFMFRNDCYHNVSVQLCQLDKDDVYDIDDENKESYKSMGVCITSLPRSIDDVDNFFKTIGQYIYSSVPTLGIATLDYGNVCYYYYTNGFEISKHLINIDSNKDETIFVYGDNNA